MSKKNVLLFCILSFVSNGIPIIGIGVCGYALYFIKENWNGEGLKKNVVLLFIGLNLVIALVKTFGPAFFLLF